MEQLEHYFIMFLTLVFGPLVWLVHKNAADERARIEHRFSALLERHERLGWHEAMGVRVAELERKVSILARHCDDLESDDGG